MPARAVVTREDRRGLFIIDPQGPVARFVPVDGLGGDRFEPAKPAAEKAAQD